MAGRSAGYRLQRFAEATEHKRFGDATDPKLQSQRDEREHTLSDWGYRSSNRIDYPAQSLAFPPGHPSEESRN